MKRADSYDTPRRPDPARLREFLETARQVKSERTAAEAVKELLRTTPAAEWPQLANREDLRNSGALERLGQESRDLLERKPQEALAIAELATTIADSLPDDAYPAVMLAQVRAAAWKDRANALRYLGKGEEAFQAIEHAEATLRPHTALVVDRAIADVVKAIIVFELGHPQVAHGLLRDAIEVFSAIRDTKHLHDAQLVDANGLYGEHRFEDASAAYGRILEEAADPELLARLHNNLGYCAAHLGDFRSANIHFSEAIAGFTDLGFRVEAMRTQRGAGALLVEKGQCEAGLGHLRAARQGFALFGMVRDAGLCGLRIAEALLTHGDADGARRMTSEVAAEFAAARFSAEVLDVLGGLERAIAADDVSVECVRHVQGLIASMPEERPSC